MRVIFECGICGRRFYASQECQQHEEICGRNRISFEEKQRFISDMSTAIVNDLIEDPKVIITGIVNYLRDINGDNETDEVIDIRDYGFDSFFELISEMYEDRLIKGVTVIDIKQKCLIDFENYLFKLHC